MKTYKTLGAICWDEIAYKKLSSEFDMLKLIEAQYGDDLVDYLILPPNTIIEIPEETIVESEQFVAPWEI